MQNKKKAVDLGGNLMDLIVAHSGSPILPFGFFLPIQKFPSLSIYTLTEDLSLCHQIVMNMQGKM